MEILKPDQVPILLKKLDAALEEARLRIVNAHEEARRQIEGSAAFVAPRFPEGIDHIIQVPLTIRPYHATRENGMRGKATIQLTSPGGYGEQTELSGVREGKYQVTLLFQRVDDADR